MNFLDWVNWNRMSHPKCRWYHFMGWGPGWNSRETVRWPTASSPLCSMTVKSADQLPHTAATTPSFPAMMSLKLWTSVHPFPLELLPVKYLVTTTTKVTNIITCPDLNVLISYDSVTGIMSHPAPFKKFFMKFPNFKWSSLGSPHLWIPIISHLADVEKDSSDN